MQAHSWANSKIKPNIKEIATKITQTQTSVQFAQCVPLSFCFLISN